MKTTTPMKLGALLIGVATTQLAAQTLAPTQWYRLRTPHVDIIFKGNISQEAQQIANILEHLYEPVAQSLGVKPTKLPLILRNQQAISNGLVTLAPRRMEFFTFPSQNYNLTSSNDCFNTLAVHEFRHVVQYAKLHQNFNQCLYWLGGDWLLGGVTGINVPVWFFEGDAVGIETALTQSGRGRIPYFSLLYRTNLLARGSFSYCKQVFGSFQDQVPDHYRVGYYLTTYLRRKYGPAVLAAIFDRTTWPRLFVTTIKKTTGKHLLQVYEDTNQELKTLWQNQLKGLKLTQAVRINPRSNTAYTDYSFPQTDQEGHIIVLKSGIGTVAQFVWLGGQQSEQKLFIPGNITQEAGFSAAQKQIVWVESIPDLRWKDRAYSVIQRYDTQAKQLKTLTHKSRYGAAALSPDTTKIVAFESDEGYKHQLVILDAENGQVLQRLPNPDNHYYLTPKWSEDGRQLVVVKNKQQKMTIEVIDVFTGERQDLCSEEHISCPVMQGQYVLYNSAYSGIDNIYAIDLATHQRYQVTSRKYGAYNPTISADGHWLIFNDFTKDGMDVARMPFDPKQWTPLEEVEDRSVHYYAPLVEQENNAHLLQHIPKRTYPVEPYPAWKHLLNVHSWSPEVDLLEKKEIKVAIQSKDLLDTTSLAVGYIHDFKEHPGKTFAKLSYQGWYPTIDLKGKLIRRNYEEIIYEQALGLKLGLPLSFMQGQYTHSLSLSTKGQIHKDKRTWFTQTYQGTFSRTSKKSLRDIYYPWEQSFRIKYLHTPYGGDVQGQSFDAQAGFYLPGLFKHHAFYLGIAYHYELRKALYGSLLTFAPCCPNEYTKDQRIVSVEYAFPIGYPDWNVGSWLYVKRLRTHAHYNFVYRPHLSQKANTVGIDLLADMHLFSLPTPLKIGIRYYYAMERKKGNFSPIFMVVL